MACLGPADGLVIVVDLQAQRRILVKKEGCHPAAFEGRKIGDDRETCPTRSPSSGSGRRLLDSRLFVHSWSCCILLQRHLSGYQEWGLIAIIFY